MASPFGRPTQIHSVPLEERAFDSKGNRLPWALEWPDGHPNARGQKRYVEEKGPFGKANKRRGSSRTRTATPAKKENPTLEGFEKALSFTLSQESQQNTPTTSRIQNETVAPSLHTRATEKQPTQVLIYGYSTESQWAALEVYERASYGIICEDYARTPPESTKKFPHTFSTPPHAQRPLTKAERAFSMRYAGGEHWVKVTFDSADAAERAIEHSPAQVHGHWVYAQLYNGSGPASDEPRPIQEGEREAGQPLETGTPQHLSNESSDEHHGQDHPASQPGTRTPQTPQKQKEVQDPSPTPSSTTTATSGTATNGAAVGTATSPADISYPNLRQRQPQSEAQTQTPSQTRMMTHFPQIPRTVLRPAHEAFLPQPTWWDRQISWLSSTGLVPKEVIGNGIPLTPDGTVDLTRASFYWRFCYWIDSMLGTDLCGLKDD